jgi:RNA polymerase sigma-70 factor (ECF subfamily)
LTGDAHFAVPADDTGGGDGRLLADARSGDRAAFEQILIRHQRQVYLTALRLLGCREDAQDAAQEVFLRLHKHLHRIANARTLGSWLYRVTVNVCRDMYRRREPAAPDAALECAAAPATDPVDTIAAHQQRRLLAEALKRLGPKERAAVVLRDLEGLPTREVARILGSAEVTVRSNLSTARVKIRAFVERFGRGRSV